ncbi:hypothetical protein GE061_017440 [Apolygus lucorum]|uniref:Uncharacterized protein n=1 Tax=Apolygus lucorum TaxID=248454 RepID=A0A6A4J2W3_APOLU|nr:hypothetical protein GE061_017440 [Apolygus lucorum]
MGNLCSKRPGKRDNVLILHRIDLMPSFESLVNREPSEINVVDVPEDIVLHTAYSSISVLKTQEDLWREQEEQGCLNRRRSWLRREKERSRIRHSSVVSGDVLLAEHTDSGLPLRSQRRKAVLKPKSHGYR